MTTQIIYADPNWNITLHPFFYGLISFIFSREETDKIKGKMNRLETSYCSQNCSFCLEICLILIILWWSEWNWPEIEIKFDIEKSKFENSKIKIPTFKDVIVFSSTEGAIEQMSRRFEPDFFTNVR